METWKQRKEHLNKLQAGLRTQNVDKRVISLMVQFFEASEHSLRLLDQIEKLVAEYNNGRLAPLSFDALCFYLEQWKQTSIAELNSISIEFKEPNTINKENGVNKDDKKSTKPTEPKQDKPS